MYLSLLIVVVGTYALHMLSVAWGLHRVRRRPEPPAPDEWPRVSVVIAARNEAAVIRDCIDSVRACDYPADRLEVVVVDDGSTDRTADTVRAMQAVPAGDASEKTAPDVRLVRMADVQPASGGKPAAIAEGVAAARGTVILTTDADCTVAPEWVRSMVRRCTPETPFVAGPVRYRVDAYRWFDRLQALEFTSLIAYGAGTLGLGMPTICNSANVAVRRDVLDGMETIPDGAAQDEVLLQHIAYGTDRDVAFNPAPEALVTTVPAPDLTSYLQQRARWASMGPRYPHWVPRLCVLLLWLTYVVLLGGVVGALVLPAWQQPVVAALLVKFAADAVASVPLVKHFGQASLLRSFVPTQLLLLGSVPLIGLLGSVSPPAWKGRAID